MCRDWRLSAPLMRATWRNTPEDGRQLALRNTGIEIARDYHEHVLAAVHALVISDDVVALDADKRAFIGGVTVRVVRTEKERLKVRSDRQLGIILGSLGCINALRDQLASLSFREGRMKHGIGKQIEPAV